MTKAQIFRYAFIRALPILLSYFFISTAYGIMMNQAGFPWFVPFLSSLIVYTGAFQFIFAALLTAGAPILTIGATALFMNSRQIFYGLTFVEAFKAMGKKYFYMVATLTDETYAVNVSLALPEEEKRRVMAWVALISHMGWVLGTLFGVFAGQLLPFRSDGIDFSMTALFAVIFFEQWEKQKDHFAAWAGLLCGIVGLFLFGEKNFILPSLISVSLIMTFRNHAGNDEVSGLMKRSNH